MHALQGLLVSVVLHGLAVLRADGERGAFRVELDDRLGLA